jgi:hypothetical protein
MVLRVPRIFSDRHYWFTRCTYARTNEDIKMQSSKFAVVWTEFLLRIRRGWSSALGINCGIADWHIVWFSAVHSSTRHNNILNNDFRILSPYTWQPKNLYRVIKKFLCTWWLQYKKHAKIFWTVSVTYCDNVVRICITDGVSVSLVSPWPWPWPWPWRSAAK